MRRDAFLRCLSCAGLAAAIGDAGAQPAAWPTGLVKMVVGYPPGGPNDTIARAICQQLASALRQPFIVDNRAGASGTIGSEFVAKAAPDGMTLMLNATTHSMVNALYDKLPFDAERDFTPITMVADSSLVLVVHPAVPIRSVRDLIALARAKPGTLAFASTGSGSSPHLAGEMFKQMAGVDLIHVPYKGSAPAITDVIGGQVPIMFEAMPSAAPYIKSGRLRAIAVSTAERLPARPDLPTIAESGLPGFEVIVWWGVFGPARMPSALAERIARQVDATLATPEVARQFASLGISPAGTTPDVFRARLHTDITTYAAIIKKAHIHGN